MGDIFHLSCICHNCTYFLCLKNENIMEGLFSNRKEEIHIPIVEGIRNVVTKGIIPAHNQNNQ